MKSFNYKKLLFQKYKILPLNIHYYLVIIFIYEFSNIFGQLLYPLLCLGLGYRGTKQEAREANKILITMFCDEHCESSRIGVFEST